MSIEAINWAIDQNIEKSSAKLLLIVLSNYASEDFICFPSITTLEKKCSCSRNTIKNSVKFLKEHGFLSSIDSENNIPKKANNGQNCYKLLVGQKLTPGKNCPRAKIDSKGGQKLTVGGAKIDPKPSYNHQLNHHNINYCAKEQNLTNENLEVKTQKNNFKKPTIDEIQNYVNEKCYKNFDTGHFFDYYESNGWMVGRNKMKCWKSAISNWIRQSKKYQASSNAYGNRSNGCPRTGLNNDDGRYDIPEGAYYVDAAERMGGE
jgi:hypothetical protein